MLGTLTVNEGHDGFLLDGKPWFWLGDTCWSAFTSVELDDWDYYLTRRAEQGVNLLQVNTLPQWDRSRPDLGIYPYASDDGTVFDWAAPNPAYWERARTMAQMATDRGLRLALVLVWCNFVPGTWGAKIAERYGAPTMPLAAAKAHVRRVVAELGEFDPVYVVTGDTDFKTDETVAYYQAVLDEIAEAAPDDLRCMHINRGNRSIPQQYLDKLDFYMYQPGHNALHQDETWKLPEDFFSEYPPKPIVNSEPCYEQMGSSGHVYVRFNARDCRASAWSGILSGAAAGVTYGASGVWNWQTSGSHGSVLGEGFDAPFRWQECLQFPGIWDYGLIPIILRKLGALQAGMSDTGITPAQHLLDDEREAIRVGLVGSSVVAYMPRATSLNLHRLEGTDLGNGSEQLSAIAIDLENRRVAHLPRHESRPGEVRVAQHPFEHDALVVVSRGA